MQVEIRFFASLVEAVGQSEITMEIDAALTPAQLWEILGREHPRLAAVSYRPLVAADLVYARWDAPLGQVAELAFLPPLSGG
jgi:molybdopterin synthase sulfur carrier subunit